jgi:hypothetical protein
MKPFAESLREMRRLVILRLLNEQHGYTANHSILHAGLLTLGVASSRDDVATDLHWLRDQGLLTLDEPVPGVWRAVLGIRGQEVATGQVVVPGVQRPSAR